MTFRFFALVAIMALSFPHVEAQYFSIKGKVTNAAMEPIAYVNVSVQEINHLGTSTNIKGEYDIKIKNGSYVLVYSFVGYKSQKIPVTVNGHDITQNIILEIEAREIQGVRVSAKRSDRSEEIIKKVIENKHKFGTPQPYTVKAYIKAVQQESKYQKKKDTTLVSANLDMAEIFMTLHYSSRDKIKEERTGVQIRGDKNSLFFLTHTDGDFNWYRNLMEIPALSATPFLSPISNSGLFAYKYKMLESFYIDRQKYYRIKVSPGIMGNALVTGELVVMDSIWCLASVKLSFPKYQMVEYDAFEVSQQFKYTDSSYFIEKQEFRYFAKYGKTKNSGRTVVYYSDYTFNQQFKKRFFNTELSSTSQEAYERDTTFWTTIRKEPFTSQEIAFIRKSDSAKALTLQKHWQDSVDKEFNTITFKKLFFTGQSFYKRSSERYWSFKPLIFAYTPIYIAGPRINYWVSYERTFKNKKYISIDPSINYGFYNNDLKGSLGVERLYDPFRRALIRGSVGSDFGIINPFEAWLNIFRRSNFFVQDQASLYHRIELLNGLYLGNGVEYSNRRSIGTYDFDSRADSLYGEENKPVVFDPYKALYSTLTLTFVPFQKYIREPYQKLVLGSNWPELTFKYRKGLNTLGSTIDFDYIELQAEQEFKLGLLGISKYRVVSGEFLTHQDLRLVDYKFQRRAGPIFFSNPLYSFQGIDSTYSTVKRFYEAHYLHRFNGALINKIPLLKKLNIIECAGGGLLYTKERNLKYVELFVGIEKVIRLWKERIKIGVFYVAGTSNQFTYKPQLKFTIEIYDKRHNRFSY
ncbi:MAG: DUF5686 and carboxypeptidase regulatory-like domain-containing protein [Bacteroidota bacterium]